MDDFIPRVVFTVAGVGVGLFQSLEQACGSMVELKGRHEPDPKNRDLYAAHFHKYVGLYDALVGMFAQESADGSA